MLAGIRTGQMPLRAAIAILAATWLAGCLQQKPGPPPLRVSYRKATIPGKGLVIGLANTSNESIQLDRVHVRSAKEQAERPYDQILKKVIDPNDSIAIGWAELDGWSIRKGDRVRIFFVEYAQPLEITVGEEAPDDG